MSFHILREWLHNGLRYAPAAAAALVACVAALVAVNQVELSHSIRQDFYGQDNGVVRVAAAPDIELSTAQQKAFQDDLTGFLDSNDAGMIYSRSNSTMQLMVYDPPGLFPWWSADLDHTRGGPAQYVVAESQQGNVAHGRFDDFTDDGATIVGTFGTEYHFEYTNPVIVGNWNTQRIEEGYYVVSVPNQAAAQFSSELEALFAHHGFTVFDVAAYDPHPFGLQLISGPYAFIMGVALIVLVTAATAVLLNYIISRRSQFRAMRQIGISDFGVYQHALLSLWGQAALGAVVGVTFAAIPAVFLAPAFLEASSLAFLPVGGGLALLLVLVVAIGISLVAVCCDRKGITP